MIDNSKPLVEQTAADLRALLDALHGNRERYDRANRIVEARSCELEIAEATRALAIINRRATEAEDQQQAEERTATAQPALTADEVRAVVRAYARDAMCECEEVAGHRLDQCSDAIAARVAECLAGRVVALSAEERISIYIARKYLADWGNDDHRDRARDVLDRLLAGAPAVDPAQREADLREAFVAGVRWGEGFPSAATRKHAQGCDVPDAAAEYARSKAGG